MVAATLLMTVLVMGESHIGEKEQKDGDEGTEEKGPDGVSEEHQRPPQGSSEVCVQTRKKATAVRADVRTPRPDLAESEKRARDSSRRGAIIGAPDGLSIGQSARISTRRASARSKRSIKTGLPVLASAYLPEELKPRSTGGSLSR